MDPYDSPLGSPIVVPITHSPIPYQEPVSRGRSLGGEELQEVGVCVGVEGSGLTVSGLAVEGLSGFRVKVDKNEHCSGQQGVWILQKGRKDESNVLQGLLCCALGLSQRRIP